LNISSNVIVSVVVTVGISDIIQKNERAGVSTHVVVNQLD
jgi:hypothetical protein